MELVQASGSRRSGSRKRMCRMVCWGWFTGGKDRGKGGEVAVGC